MPQGVLARLRAAYKRLGEASEEDLKAIANAKDGAIPHELIYVVDGPQDIDYDDNANPQMLFIMEDIRMGAVLTKLEKKLVAEAKKRLSARKSGGKRKTRRVGSKKSRKSRRTRRR